MLDAVQSATSLLSKGLNAVTTSSKSNDSFFSTAASAAATAAVGPGFGSILADLASNAVGSLKKSETMAFEGIQGTASTREVVDAMLEAEQSLKTAISIRDKAVQAYLEITKMQI
ncbi:MAG: flagellar hook-basal body complex protein FliE [Proteobacteria bacterium]|nr:flagellar hook-basal body complex protein FliE [Pseudomonadota bacterium]